MNSLFKKIAFSSDFHIDATRLEVIKELKQYLLEQEVDIFCFAGDMSKDVKKSVKILKEIQNDLHIKVLAISGNHEMRDRSFSNSFEALRFFNQELGEISLMNQSFSFYDWTIVGHMGWYDYSTAPLKYNDYQLHSMEFNQIVHGDKYCNWEGKVPTHVADLFLEDLKNQLDRVETKNIIVLSHMVPFKEVLDYSINEEWSYWNSFVGNVCIGDLLLKYPVKLIHFGHTHKRKNYYKDEREIVCSPLGYENEWSSSTIKEEIKKAVSIYTFFK